MAYYLVRASARRERLPELERKLHDGDIRHLRPFGVALDESLRGARLEPDGTVVWEENDYCNPPLAMEREAVLDHYFDAITTQEVGKGEGWLQINHLPSLWHRTEARR